MSDRAKEKRIIKGIVAKVSKQIPSKPDAKLMFSVFKIAAMDLSPVTHGDAAAYMRSNMPHLELMGIDAEWIRRLFKDEGVEHWYK
ncbi:MAG: hypothetical protein COB69_00225 [Phycisphaera sp.]|nr:MAG: hypothetical protein COB69_00225 [Phycisphaera sp.]